jgi:hypothetical protein
MADAVSRFAVSMPAAFDGQSPFIATLFDWLRRLNG